MPYDLAFDVRAKNNRNPRFRPLAGNLKTEDRADQLNTDKPNGDFVKMQVIPGYRLEIDTKARKARIVDLLKLPENSGVVKSIRTCFRNNPRYTGEKLTDQFVRDDCVPEGEFDLNGDPPMNLATWLWHCFTMVRSGNLKVVKGELPGSDDIRRMGDIWLSDNNGISAKEGRRAWNYLYTDEVEPESKRAVAGKGA